MGEEGQGPAGTAVLFKRETFTVLCIQRGPQSFVDIQSVGGKGTPRNRTMLAAPTQQVLGFPASVERMLEGCRWVIPQGDCPPGPAAGDSRSLA